MAIVGIGIDIVDLARFERAVSRTPALRDRLFALSERDLPLRSLAGRFAAKEALIKALGDSTGVGWHDMEVVSDEHGNPGFVVHGAVAGHPRAARDHRPAPLDVARRGDRDRERHRGVGRSAMTETPFREARIDLAALQSNLGILRSARRTGRGHGGRQGRGLRARHGAGRARRDRGGCRLARRRRPRGGDGAAGRRRPSSGARLAARRRRGLRVGDRGRRRPRSQLAGPARAGRRGSAEASCSSSSTPASAATGSPRRTRSASSRARRNSSARAGCASAASSATSPTPPATRTPGSSNSSSGCSRRPRAAGLEPELRHLASSQAAIERPETRFDLVRIGVALYGLPPARHRRCRRSRPPSRDGTRRLGRGGPPGARGFGRLVRLHAPHRARHDTRPRAARLRRRGAACGVGPRQRLDRRRAVPGRRTHRDGPVPGRRRRRRGRRRRPGRALGRPGDRGAQRRGLGARGRTPSATRSSRGSVRAFPARAVP